MKQIRYILFFLIVFQLVLTGCKQSDSQTKYPEYTDTVNSELGCVELSYDGVIYRPFGVFSGDGLFTFDKFIGNQIGIRVIGKDDPPTKMYEIRGYGSKEWIVEYDDMLMGGNMIFKAVDVTDIPAELEKYKEYDF